MKIYFQWVYSSFFYDNTLQTTNCALVYFWASSVIELHHPYTRCFLLYAFIVVELYVLNYKGPYSDNNNKVRVGDFVWIAFNFIIKNSVIGFYIK